MNSIGVSGVLAILLLLGTTVKGDEGVVSFWKKDFTMTCPYNGTWHKGQIDSSKNEKYKSMTLEYKTPGHYICQYNDTKTYQFYVKGQVCENCYELNGNVVALALVADLLVTGMVILLVYMWAKRKHSAAPTPTPQVRPGGRAAQPGQSSHYEQLNHTRTPDTYSTVNRMG